MTDERRKIFIIMGVAGAGKTSVGECVAKEVGCPFFEGDSFHSEEAKAQMASGQPLTDADRIPWIMRMAEAINHTAEPCSILACSALSRFVRYELETHIKGAVFFIHLKADRSLLLKRLEGRKGHYMKGDMLDSQLDALEITPDMQQVDIDQPIDAVCHSVQRLIVGVQ